MIARISDQRLSVDEHRTAVGGDASGACVLFTGVVRDHDHDRPVRELEYVAHPSAAQVIADVAAGIVAIEEVDDVAVSHRVGVLGVGDVALVAAVSAAHRRAAFEACALLVDEVKTRLPIWKRQVFHDGSDEWVNCP
ncbi:MAG: molybdenum cofactor biosynthesis protein MoaE [Mycobacteriales bacterium]|nr:MAG: molybdenum cofactor biosynthesis protein MoaE [Pseudonocardiales bacterium]